MAIQQTKVTNPVADALPFLQQVFRRQSPPQRESPTKTNNSRSRLAKLPTQLAAVYLGARLLIAGFHHQRRRNLRRLLREVCQAVREEGVAFWLDFGSLLGIHRDGDLILHDNDVDIAVLNPDWTTLLPALKARLGPKYSVKIVTPKDHPESSWIRVYCPLGMADLFGASMKENNTTVAVDCGHGDTMHIDKNLILPTTEVEWRDITLTVPHDIEGTLEFRYGPTWRVPRYLDKGKDTVEGSKPYAKVLRGLGRLGLRF